MKRPTLKWNMNPKSKIVLEWADKNNIKVIDLPKVKEYNKIKENKMTRIRYKNNDGVLVSTREMLLNDKLVTVTIDTTVNPVSYSVTDTEGNVVLSGTSNAGLHLAQKLVKQELKKAGMNFSDEVRQKKMTELSSDEPVAALAVE